MKTVFINCSPKKRLSASGFIAGFTGVFVRGKKLSEKLCTKGDYSRVLEAVRGADNVVFSMPLYVDGVPSHVLPFLKEMEKFCRENGSNFNVYVIANNGFIEGKQNEPLMQVMENFCERSGNRWCGGLGIGGGVMMNVLRILITVFFALMLVNVLRGLLLEHAFKTEYLILFAKQALEVLVFGCGIITFDIWLATLHKDYAAGVSVYHCCGHILRDYIDFFRRNFSRLAFKKTAVQVAKRELYA